MSDLVTYDQTDGIATIVMDDGKVNVMSTAMSQAVDAALQPVLGLPHLTV